MSSTSKERGHCLSLLFSSGSLEVIHFGNNKEGLEAAGYLFGCRFNVILGTRSEAFWCLEVSGGFKKT